MGKGITYGFNFPMLVPRTCPVPIIKMPHIYRSSFYMDKMYSSAEPVEKRSETEEQEEFVVDNSPTGAGSISVSS